MISEVIDAKLGSVSWRIERDGKLESAGVTSYDTPEGRTRAYRNAREVFMGWVDDNKAAHWRFGEHRVQIHRHMDFPPERWFVSCYSLGIERQPMKAEGFDDASREAAKQEAIAFIETTLVGMLEAFEAARDG